MDWKRGIDAAVKTLTQSSVSGIFLYAPEFLAFVCTSSRDFASLCGHDSRRCKFWCQVLGTSFGEVTVLLIAFNNAGAFGLTQATWDVA